MKNEDCDNFVGLWTSVVDGQLNFGLDTKQNPLRPIPKYAHARSNISVQQIRALMKGSIARAIDSAVDENILRAK